MMDARRFDMSANTSYMQKHIVDKAFQSLLEESMLFEGPVIQKRFHPNRTDLDLSSARADLFTSIKNKTFDKGWRQEIAKKSMSFSQNQSNMSGFPPNHSRWRNVSNIHNVGNYMTGVTSKKPSLSPHKESSSVLKNTAPAKFTFSKMPPPKNPSLKTVQEETKNLDKHVSGTKKHNLRSQAKDSVTELQPRILVKDLKKARKTSPKKLRTSDRVKKIKHSPPLASKGEINKHKPTSQKRNLVTDIQPHEMVMVSNVQKQKLRSFSANLNDKYSSQSNAKTIPPQCSASEVPTNDNNNKRKRKISNCNISFHGTIPKRRKIQNPDPRIQNTDPKIKKSETKSTTQKTERKILKSKSKPKSPLQLPNVTVKEQYLDKWIVFNNEINDVFIKGHVIDCSPNIFWRSTRIVKRIKNCVLATESGTNYIIQGPPFAAAMLSKGFSQDVIEQFQNGFPWHWKSILKCTPASNSNVHEKRPEPEKRTRRLPVRASNNLKSTENNATAPSEMVSTSAEKNIPFGKDLLESSLSDEISNSSDDAVLTEMDSTATDLLKLLEVKHRNKVSNNCLNNLENSSTSLDSNNNSVRLRNVSQQKVLDSKKFYSKMPASNHTVISKKRHKTENKHCVNSPQLIIKKELKRKKRKSIHKSLEPDSSEESSLSDSGFNTSLRKITTSKEDNFPTTKSGSPSKTDHTSLKKKGLSPATKMASPKKQKELHPKSRENKSQPKRLTSKTGINSRQKPVKPKTRVRSVSEPDSAPETKLNKINKINQQSPSKNVAGKTRNKKSSKSAAEYKKKEIIWSDEELECMMRTMSKLSSADPRFWSKVARKVGKSAMECKSQYNNNQLPSSKVKSPKTSRNKKPEKSAQPNTGNAKGPQEDFEDELFESENVKKNSKNLNFNPEDKLEDIFGDLCAFTPRASSDQNFQSSMGKFFLTPVSERHTPASSFSDMEVKIDWDNATHCINNFKKNQKKGAGRLKLFNKRLNLQNLEGPRKLKPQDLVSELNKLNEIPEKSKTKAENADDDSDQLSYFSDSDNN